LYPGYDPQRDANPNSPMHWFGQFLTALLQHKQPVWDLLEPPPFPVEKITHIRARLYRYHFTSPKYKKPPANGGNANCSANFSGTVTLQGAKPSNF
jgi:lipase maturation factor 1